MSYNFWKNIKIKKGSGGVGNVTDNEKCATIDKADSTWERMGLTQEQRAFGIASMNVESGFNPAAKNPGSTAYGLGQFIDPTWKDAVTYYNDKIRGKNESKIYPDVSRSDPDAQIKVMGAWIQRVWGRAKELAGDPKLKDYSFIETAYGVWHEGVYAKIDDLKNKDGKIIQGIKTFLKENEFGSIRPYLNSTYVEAHDAIDIKSILIKPNSSNTSGTKGWSGQTNGSTGETLQRQGNQVWRIEPDGSTRGYFISE